jgi:hypothetical protein
VQTRWPAHGLAGGVFAAVVAFKPSCSFILLGGGRFEQMRESRNREPSWTEPDRPR